ncbi:MAG: hypothetical protein A4E35_01379 [Methanoregula sp. PtaU1.Bin051]|nr:MAG: hypothetical protein A4E35_01379 [Methanoregula sp. PtaU1.Bin051]
MEKKNLALKDIAVVSVFLVLAALISLMMAAVESGGWSGVDAERFHYMARMIINGFTPYVSFVDPKPPLLYFTVAFMDMIGPAGSLDLPVIACINVACAFLLYRIGRDDYGHISGFTAGLLYLITAIFVQGYFFFSEQFALLFLLSAMILARRADYVLAGLMIGLAFGFKQYAILGLIPILYLMRARGNRAFHRLLVPAAGAGLASYLLVYLLYGSKALTNAIHWTIGIAPTYIGGGIIAEIPNYAAGSQFSFAVSLLAGIAVVLPVVLFASASVARRGLVTPEEWTIALFAIIFSTTIFVRQYLHYWILILPFLALLACREFADDR